MNRVWLALSAVVSGPFGMLGTATGPVEAPERFIGDWLRAGRRDVAALVRADGLNPKTAQGGAASLGSERPPLAERLYAHRDRTGHIPPEIERRLPKAGLGPPVGLPHPFRPRVQGTLHTRTGTGAARRPTARSSAQGRRTISARS